MAQLIIESDNKLLINSLALWFESGDALEAFVDSPAGNTAEKAGVDLDELDDNNPPSIQWDESDFNPTHKIELD